MVFISSAVQMFWVQNPLTSCTQTSLTLTHTHSVIPFVPWPEILNVQTLCSDFLVGFRTPLYHQGARIIWT